MKQILAAALLVLGAAVVASARQDSGNNIFDHYEAIRVALSSDTLKGVAEHSTALALLAGETASADAKRAAEQLGAATELKDARQHFGVLSAALLPMFEKAKLKDVYLYTCSMVKLSWAQRGKEIQNPYMGKAMAGCGVPAKPQNKK